MNTYFEEGFIEGCLKHGVPEDLTTELVCMMQEKKATMTNPSGYNTSMDPRLKNALIGALGGSFASFVSGQSLGKSLRNGVLASGAGYIGTDPTNGRFVPYQWMQQGSQKLHNHFRQKPGDMTPVSPWQAFKSKFTPQQ